MLTNFFSIPKEIRKALNGHKAVKLKFCSRICRDKNKIKQVSVNCNQCNKIFFKRLDQFKKTKNHFCSQSCSATYNNTHKTHGTRRSKLETWLEKQLPSFYPNLQFDFNKKDTINSELDIYIPSLKLAFELNGIYHYEPIHGQGKLDQIQNNDQRKFLACAENHISLCIIDTSGLSYFKPKNAEKYLNIITEIINKTLKGV